MSRSAASTWSKAFSSQALATAAQLLTFLAAFLGLFGTVWYVAAVAGGLALALYVGSLVVGRRERRKMKSHVDRLVDAMDLDHVLRLTATSLGLGGPGQGWRLSLYRLDFATGHPETGRWELQARAANQKAYELARDFEYLALTQGVLRTALAAADQPLGGIDEMPALPNPDDEAGEWLKVMSAWGLQGPSVEGAMRSRTYCGRVFRVGLNRGRGQDMTLALVAESESPTGVRRQAMEEVLTRPVFELFYELMRVREDIRTSLSGIDDVNALNQDALRR